MAFVGVVFVPDGIAGMACESCLRSLNTDNWPIGDSAHLR